MVEVFTTTATGLPCSWDVTTGASQCCPEWDTLDPTVQAAAAEYGALTVWAATGRRFGLCERTVRPCGRTCKSCGGAGYFWSEGTWIPFILNGEWRNCACGSDIGCCSCEPSCQVWLPPPVYAISPTGISQDGAVVPVDAWRVDNGQWLVRTDGNCWPMCQNYDVDSGIGFFSVTYQQGLPVPAVLARAAGELACEWARSCTGGVCRLPQRITSIARQGVTVSFADVNQLLDNGLTGLLTVDQVIRTFNPYRLTSAMRIASPDLPVVRTTTIA